VEGVGSSVDGRTHSSAACEQSVSARPAAQLSLRSWLWPRPLSLCNDYSIFIYPDIPTVARRTFCGRSLGLCALCSSHFLIYLRVQQAGVSILRVKCEISTRVHKNHNVARRSKVHPSLIRQTVSVHLNAIRTLVIPSTPHSHHGSKLLPPSS